MIYPTMGILTFCFDPILIYPKHNFNLKFIVMLILLMMCCLILSMIEALANLFFDISIDLNLVIVLILII